MISISENRDSITLQFLIQGAVDQQRGLKFSAQLPARIHEARPIYRLSRNLLCSYFHSVSKHDQPNNSLASKTHPQADFRSGFLFSSISAYSAMDGPLKGLLA
jgi:hypothetical protein